jgi:hypothetical protein
VVSVALPTTKIDEMIENVVLDEEEGSGVETIHRH